jgi:RHH-type rel operon transcriptional repressor/antitoxin RelB
MGNLGNSPENKLTLLVYCIQMSTTTETLSIRLDAKTKKRLEALAIRSKRSKSFLAAEAVAAYVEAEEWQLGEIETGLKELDRGETVGHEKVSKWLRSWGKTAAGKSSR